MLTAGVDLGTTYSAAAVADGFAVRVFELSSQVAVMPSVVVARPDGTVLVGEAAQRRAHEDPSRVGREFKRRLGDPTPLILGGTPYGAEALSGLLLGEIVARVSETEGIPPDTVVVTHPATYSEFKLDLLRQAARSAGVDSVVLVPEPVAAAVYYAELERIDKDEVIAVYDFGGGTFDAAVLRQTDGGFEVIGTPEGMERLGGIDLDEAVLAHVTRSLGDAWSDWDQPDPVLARDLVRLREECRKAKEALSHDADATIPVSLANLRTDVRITRAEFEDMIRPRVRETVGVLHRTIRSTGLDWDDLSRILLVGGSSRIPLVREMVRAETGRPVALDAHPKHTVALGAAALGRELPTERVAASPVSPVAAEAPPTPVGAAPEPSRSAARSPDSTPIPVADRPSEREWRRPPPWAWAGLAGVIMVGAIIALVVMSGGGDEATTGVPLASETTTSAVTTEPAEPGTTAVPSASETTTSAVTTEPAEPATTAAAVAASMVVESDGHIRRVATGFGSVWAIGSSDEVEHLYQIDPDTGTVVADHPLEVTTSSGGTYGLAVGEEFLWTVSEDTLFRIDPDTGSVSIWYFGADLGFDATLWDVAASDLTVWVATVGPLSATDLQSNEAHLIPVDPTLDWAPSAEAAVRGIPIDVLAFYGSVWVLPYGEEGSCELLEIDPGSLDVVAHVDLTAGCKTGIGSLVAGDGFVWATDNWSGYVRKIDPATHTEVDRLYGEGSNGRVAHTEGTIWVATSGSTNEVWGYSVDDFVPCFHAFFPGSVDGLAATDDALWVVNWDSGTLHRMTPEAVDR